MKLAYHDGRLFAIAAFLLCISATLAILLGDVFAGLAPFALKHWLTIVVLFGTILFGHIAKKAGWLDPKKYGMWLVFWLGTVLIAYSSIGRQSESMTISVEQAKLDFTKRDRADKEILANQTMLDGARAEAIKLSCEKTPYRKRCKEIARTVDVYTAAIVGNQAIIDKLGPAKPVAPEADKLAEALSMFSYDEKRTKALAVMLQPVGYFAFFEYGSILALGYLLNGSRKTKRATASLPQPTPSVVTSLAAEKIQQQPVSVKDSQQSSFQTPPAREHKHLIAAGLLTAEGEVPFKTPPRWTYEKDLN